MSKILFDTPASEWNLAFPVGNGFLGGMVFGGVARERVQLNEDSVWSGGPMDRVNPACREHIDEIRQLLLEGKPAEAEELAKLTMYPAYPHPRHYQKLGDLFIDFVGDASADEDLDSYTRALDLERGLASVEFGKGGRRYKRVCFASNPDKVLVYRIEAEDEQGLSFVLHLARKGEGWSRFTSYCDGCRAESDDSLVLWGANGGADGIRFALMTRVVAEGGELAAFGGRLSLKGARAATVYVTARTSVRSDDPQSWCRKVLDAATNKGYERLLEGHMADYRELFNRCRLRFGASCEENETSLLTTPERLLRLRAGECDPELIATYFDFGRYLLISSSREGSLPANLQGIWNSMFDPPWGSKYTVNINLQMNYWLAEASGLGDLCQPLFDLLETMHPQGKRVAQEMYGARGFCCHHNTDIWGDCAPVDAWPASTPWALGAAWLCLHVLDHYRYAHDEAFAKRYFNLLRDAVLFCLDWQVQDARGVWLSGPSLSPENTYVASDGSEACLCMSPAMDTEIMRELFEGYAQLCAGMDVEDELLPEIAERLEHMPQIEVGKNGCIREWLEDYEETSLGHRHLSHLFALYPGTAVRQDLTPELAEAAHNSLERRAANGGGRTGWSKAWMTLLYARLGDAAAAWEHLQGLLTQSSFDNLLCVHPPFQIDGNFGGAAAVLELLVRDYGDDVFLLPALPEALAEGEVRGVRLKCGAVLDMRWSEGSVVDLSLHALRNGSITLRVNGEDRKLSLTAGENVLL